MRNSQPTASQARVGVCMSQADRLSSLLSSCVSTVSSTVLWGSLWNTHGKTASKLNFLLGKASPFTGLYWGRHQAMVGGGLP